MFLPYEIRTNLPIIKENSRGILLTLLLLLLCGMLKAQQGAFLREKKTEHYQRYRIEGGLQGVKELQPESRFTSLAVTLESEQDFRSLYCVAGEDTLKIEPAVHQPEGKEGLISNLLVFKEPQENIRLLGELAVEKTITVHFFYAAPMSGKAGGKSERRLASPCDEPVAVPQSVWRKGLPDPDYTRSFNRVEHLIVHHSAAGNGTANYTEEVRNYYLYHTQGNGWSDIGYNYLIAPDGTLYAGRDPGEGEQDNVTGAHFCGQNRETMGVCLIGDYTRREPTAAAMLQLEHLLSWKSLKEQLDPLAVSPHPANQNLGVIAGHRDGCATSCPGDQVYRRLPELRLAVSANLIACGEKGEQEEVWVYFASREQEVCLAGVEGKELSSFQVYNVQGKRISGVPERLKSDDYCVKMDRLSPGVYFVYAERGKEIIRQKILLF